MRVLILGGFGYLGSRIAQYLSKIDFEIILASRTQHNKPTWSANTDTFLMNWDNINLASIKFDAIIHAASLNMNECIDNPLDAINFSKKTKELIGSIQKTTAKKFIYFSTAHVYSSPLAGNIKEDAPLKSKHPYAIMHKNSESYIREFSQKGQINGVILRLSNSIGPPMEKNSNCWKLLVNDLCLQIAKEGRMRLKTNGRQERNFIAISDVAKAVAFFLNKPYSTLEDGIFNLGTEVNMTVFDMAHLIKDRARNLLGKEVPLYFESNQESKNADFFSFDISKIKNSGFNPSASSLINEIDNTLLFCINNF